MSMGYGLDAVMIDEDEKTVIYAYSGYNLNIPEYDDVNHVKDGLIMIDKSCFVEPEIRQKVKRMPNGRKKIISKKLFLDIPYSEYLKKKLITVENCSNSWEIISGYDKMALKFIFYLFERYKENYNIPKKLGIFC